MRISGGACAALLVFAVASCSASPLPSAPTAAPTEIVPVVCSSPPGSVTDIASEPNWRPFADYRVWTTATRCIVRIDVLGDRPGPAHCGWAEARVLVTGIPVGARYSDDGNAVNFVRDPDDVFGDPATAARFDADATLPSTAIDTGFRQERSELWVDPADSLSIYLVTGPSVERWPLDPDPAGCM